MKLFSTCLALLLSAVAAGCGSGGGGAAPAAPFGAPTSGADVAPVASDASDAQEVAPDAPPSWSAPWQPTAVAPIATASAAPAPEVAAVTSAPPATVAFAAVQVDPDFDYETSTRVELEVRVADDRGAPLPGVMVEARTPTGARAGATFTDVAGVARTAFQVAVPAETFTVYVHTLGIPNSRQFAVAPVVSASFGGAQ